MDTTTFNTLVEIDCKIQRLIKNEMVYKHRELGLPDKSNIEIARFNRINRELIDNCALCVFEYFQQNGNCNLYDCPHVAPIVEMIRNYIIYSHSEFTIDVYTNEKIEPTEIIKKIEQKCELFNEIINATIYNIEKNIFKVTIYFNDIIKNKDTANFVIKMLMLHLNDVNL
jgi:hypothetical protein